MAECCVAEAPFEARARGFSFVLLDQFSLLSFAGAVEVLRLANYAAGRVHYRWQILTDGGAPVRASMGAVFQADAALGPLPADETVVLCGGMGIDAAASRTLVHWLRRQARRGVRIGALCTASHVLARAGMLHGRPATIHWEHHAAMAEAFPDLDLRKSVYVLDGGQFSTAGGTAAVDLMLRVVAQDHGEALAAEVADQVIHTTIRTEEDTQRRAIPARLGVHNARLGAVIERMTASIEEPISLRSIAHEAGLSIRQLERLFRRHLDRSPKQYYMALRLERARALLTQTDMSVINVALACGFASPSHFSKCYQALYRVTPYRERGRRQMPALCQPDGDGESR